MAALEAILNTFADTLFGPCIRSWDSPTAQAPLYLTFDDGPTGDSTPAVLDVLAQHGVQATFFVIVQQAQKHRAIIRRIQAEGHAVGNHSLDHRYGNFFASMQQMQTWIEDSQKTLTDILGEAPIGFRAPSGVRTPKLHRVLRDLNIPLIHWNTRFYDSVYPWKEQVALKSLKQSRPGDIILLHDNRRQDLQHFLHTLHVYMNAAQTQGFKLERLPNHLATSLREDRRHLRIDIQTS